MHVWKHLEKVCDVVWYFLCGVVSCYLMFVPRCPQESAANRCTVWMCVRLGECKCTVKSFECNKTRKALYKYKTIYHLIWIWYVTNWAKNKPVFRIEIFICLLDCLTMASRRSHVNISIHKVYYVTNVHKGQFGWWWFYFLDLDFFLWNSFGLPASLVTTCLLIFVVISESFLVITLNSQIIN